MLIVSLQSTTKGVHKIRIDQKPTVIRNCTHILFQTLLKLLQAHVKFAEFNNPLYLN